MRRLWRRWRAWVDPEDEDVRRRRARAIASSAAVAGALLLLPLVAIYVGILVGLFSWAFGAMP